MNFDSWVEAGWLKQTGTSPAELQALVELADRYLADSLVTGVSTDAVFMQSFHAILTCARVLLLSEGYRLSHKGQHYYAIESLRETLGTDAEVDVLQRLRSKRNTLQYEQAGVVSEKEARAIGGMARDIQHRTVVRLSEKREGDI